MGASKLMWFSESLSVAASHNFPNALTAKTVLKRQKSLGRRASRP